MPLDGLELAECVLPHVESIAKGGSVQEVVFFRVVETLQWVVEPPYMSSGMDESISFMEGEDIRLIDSKNMTAAENYLNQLVTRIQYEGVAIQSEVVMGRAAESITECSAKNEVDLIIIATHGRSGVSRWVWGSVADRVLRSTCVPVLMIRAPGCVAGI